MQRDIMGEIDPSMTRIHADGDILEVMVLNCENNEYCNVFELIDELQTKVNELKLENKKLHSKIKPYDLKIEFKENRNTLNILAYTLEQMAHKTPEYVWVNQINILNRITETNKYLIQKYSEKKGGQQQ